ncbi:MAG: cysteine desulfurase family protein [Acidobacteriota bacterium]
MPPDAPPQLIDLGGRLTLAQHPEGNCALPGLLHRLEDPLSATEALKTARESVAKLFHADPEEVIFTSGGTEASNAAIKGLAAAADHQGGPRRILLSAVEHLPVLHAARSLERQGYQVREVPVSASGHVDARVFQSGMNRSTAFAALQWANHELGVLQPVGAVARMAEELGIPLHVDATAAAGWVNIDWPASRATTLSVSSRHMGGPPGVGALLVRTGQPWFPLVEGGLQEEGRRAGVLHPALVTGFGLSALAAARHLRERSRRAARLAAELARACREKVKDLAIVSDEMSGLPGHLLLRVSGVDGEALLVGLARAGIEASSASPCAHGGRPSRMLQAIGMTPAESASTLLIRVTASHPDSMIAPVAEALAAVAGRLRAMAP